MVRSANTYECPDCHRQVHMDFVRPGARDQAYWTAHDTKNGNPCSRSGKRVLWVRLRYMG